jgi:hypothetical protein
MAVEPAKTPQVAAVMTPVDRQGAGSEQSRWPQDDKEKREIMERSAAPGGSVPFTESDRVPAGVRNSPPVRIEFATSLLWAISWRQPQEISP